MKGGYFFAFAKQVTGEPHKEEMIGWFAPVAGKKPKAETGKHPLVYSGPPTRAAQPGVRWLGRANRCLGPHHQAGIGSLTSEQ